MTSASMPPAAVMTFVPTQIQLSRPQSWDLQLELYGKLDKDESKIAVSARSILLVIAKAETGFWPRLLRQTGKAPNNIKVDWNKVLSRTRSHAIKCILCQRQ
jgi:hypothetical protein